MPRNRILQQLLIQWKNAVSDWKRRFRRGVNRTRSAVSSSVSSAGRSLTDAPKKAQSTTQRSLRSLPQFCQSLWQALLRTPSALTGFSRGAVRQARDVGDTVKATVKGAQVQAQEQPGDLGRGVAGFWRRTRAFVWDRPLWARSMLLILLVALLSAPFTARPAYRALVGWRAERLSERALIMATEGRDQEAFDTAQAAFLLNRNNPSVVRTVAALAQAINHPQTLDYLSIAVAQAEPSPEMIALFVEESIRRGNLSQARPYLTWLQQTQTDAPSTVALNIRYFIAEGQREVALEEVTEAVTEFPADIEILSLYAALALNEASPETTDEGLTYLRSNASQDTIYGLTALRILLTSELVSGPERADFARTLSGHPMAERDDQLLAYSSMLASKVVAYPEIESDISSLFDLSDNADLRDYGRWLLLNGLPTDALALIPEAKAKSNKQFFQIYLTGMLESGRGQEVLEMLSSGVPVPLSPVERLIFQAGIQKQLGLDESFETAAGLAISRAEVRDFAYLQRSIEYFENDKLMLDFYRRVSREPRLALLGKSRLFALAYKLNESEIVEALVTQLNLRDLKPYPGPQNTLAYIKLIRGEDLDEARRTAENLVARFPSLIDYRVTLALAYLRSGDSTAARAVLSPQLAERDGFREGWKVAIVALLDELEETDQARELAGSLDREALTTDEIAYLAEYGF